MKIFRKIIVLKLVAVFILVTSCATDPTKVSGEDAQRLIATGAIVGGVVGYYLPVKLGEHNGFQYVISIDDKKKPLTLIQGEIDKNDEGFTVGQRVTIVFGKKTIRMLPGQV